jgi:hypothetical protein
MIAAQKMIAAACPERFAGSMLKRKPKGRALNLFNPYYRINMSPVVESGLGWFALPTIGKFIAGLVAWEIGFWGINELLEADENAGEDSRPGIDSPIGLNKSAQELELKKLSGLKARGLAMLDGNRYLVYSKMIQELADKVAAGEGTGREIAGARSLLWRYTLKYGRCTPPAGGWPAGFSLNEDEIAWCEYYKKIHGPAAPATDSSIVEAKQKKDAGIGDNQFLPWVVVAAAFLLVAVFK